jgi:hypothetical protein
MTGTKQNQAGSKTSRNMALQAGKYAIALSAVAGIVLSTAGFSSAAQAASAAPSATARIQSLLNNPVSGTVNLPRGTFTVRPDLVLNQGERIVGHHTTLKVASGSGNYAAVLAGATTATNLSGLTITGVTFDQNASGNPISDAAALYNGKPRFVVRILLGSDIKIVNDRFIGTDNVNTVVTGGGTSGVTISGNVFKTINTPLHDHSSIYTSGTGTVISDNTLIGTAAYYSAAIEVHGDRVRITGNHVSGYFRGANIVASDATFTGNHVSGAGSPVDLWSVAPTALHNVTVTGNVLNRNLPGWRAIVQRLGLRMPAAIYTQQVIRDATSTLHFQNITVHGNSQ